ncbi:tripartite tricarboxylate transporter substrate binding protein [Roseococcus sp. SYP-B2431]|uniref:tripartite tricarboxylate transporter substrate binding protein n=1 Tax=Roseococcus sp. SYP-B2431 TaxID=2496640 RepID=UPI00103BE628|nr:tripartite tricarboxylate transporter substrate binding protein [Roseococcus sp. SYP-B2431]TCH98329.1 tripartite tricarboxylate transporter substrate binding protein [Roseococcus sp. SYP-B2431]
MPSRRLTLAAAMAAPLAAPRPGRTQGFPQRPIRVFCTGPAGSSTDLPLRAVTDFMARRLGQPVIVDNRSGAGGALAAQAVVQSRADGHTLGNCTVSVLRAAYMTPSVTYDPMADFSYVAQLGGYTVGIAVKADAPWRSWAELMDWARAHPGQLIYAASGIGTGGHIAMEIVARQAGIEAVFVPYRGSSDVLGALLAGSVNVISDGAFWAGAVRDGSLRLLAISSSARRIPRYPDTPTLNELGYEFDGTASLGIIGPHGIPEEAARPLQVAMREAMQDPGVRAVFDRFDLTPGFVDGPDFDAAMRRIASQERGVLNTLGLLRGAAGRENR